MFKNIMHKFGKDKTVLFLYMGVILILVFSCLWIDMGVKYRNIAHTLLNSYDGLTTSGVPTPTPTLDLGLMCKCSITFNTSFPDSTFVYYHDNTNYATGYFIMDWGSRISDITAREYELTNLPICEIVDLP